MRIPLSQVITKMTPHGVNWPVLGYDTSHGPVDWAEVSDGRTVERLSFGLAGSGEQSFDSPDALGAGVAGWLAEHAFARLFLVAADGEPVPWRETAQFWFEPGESRLENTDDATAPTLPGEALELHAGRVALGRLIAWIVARESQLDVWLVGVARGRAAVVQIGSARGVALSWRDGDPG